ncbi:MULTISPECIES: HEAT repeat domain-containing protein [unclassified Anabaena]|uniref:HEAT repeat domain-containing protein n=1 Tax=unclassified Anabaena TaxID=2619674 RepID=UPI001445E9C1|nr:MULTISPECIES: HEAT repeat domain-containing protein [unclassified Anabaena]MTJ10966.1 HEAT repeat domain-containing protein [Anabaena sp. UHCC 0204]MTJ51923.1 HEAT repeat domain-containing protein [Anabaena sp. UHCC 0253]
MDFTWENNWLLWGRQEQDIENQLPFELTWITSDQQTGLHYIEDYVVGFPYLVIKGKDMEKTLLELQEYEIHFYSLEEIIDCVKIATTIEEMKTAILHLGVAITQPYDSELFDILCQTLEHSSPIIRNVVIQAIAYIGWTEFKPILEKIYQNDLDDKVRNKAYILLESFEIVGI